MKLDVIIKRGFEVEEKGGYPFFYLGAEEHFQPQYTIWVSPEIAKPGQLVHFPLSNSKIIRTRKGNYVLKEEEGWITYYLYVPAGYRGCTKIYIIEEPQSYDFIIFDEYRSEKGRLGISRGALITAPLEGKIVVGYERGGRLYGKPSQGFLILQRGEIKVCEGVSYLNLADLEEIMGKEKIYEAKTSI